MKGSRGSLALTLLLLAALCALAYGPTLSIPLIEDDYPNLWEAHSYGPASALPMLLHNSVFRLRATTYWTMWPMWRLFGAVAWPYHLFSLMLHVANVWLAYAVARLWRRMRTAAFWAAAFFAVAEGHQEAVMWFSAINELYMFLFGAASLAVWLMAGRRWYLHAASAALFALALVSKESAVVWLPLFVLAQWGGPPGLPSSRSAPPWPHVLLAALAVTSVAASRGESFRFSDGSFSLHAPFWIIWPYGVVRALGVFGWLALAALLLFRVRKPAFAALACEEAGGSACPTREEAGGSACPTREEAGGSACPTRALAREEAGGSACPTRALAWIGIALIPYSFLTYSRQIPSRQTYLASFGVALLVGLALAHLAESRNRTRLVAAVAVIVLLGNVGYLWTKKRAQFLARAEPTEELIQLARRTDGPIWVQCFPRVPYIAQEAVHMAAGRSPSTLIWSEAEAKRRTPAAVFCYKER